MTMLLLVALLGGGLLQHDAGAVERFYDPAGTRGAAPNPPAVEGALRGIPVVSPFPPYGNVGIHYWFQSDAGARLTEDQAATTDRPYTLHIRDNVDGFLTVWLVSDEGETQLTPVQGRYSGYMLPCGSEYVVPAPVRFTRDTTRRLIIVFSRSQTEQAADAVHALKRLQAISDWKTPEGSPQLVRGTDTTTAAQLGTYVVNRRGMPVAAEIPLRSR